MHSVLPRWASAEGISAVRCALCSVCTEPCCCDSCGVTNWPWTLSETNLWHCADKVFRVCNNAVKWSLREFLSAAYWALQCLKVLHKSATYWVLAWSDDSVRSSKMVMVQWFQTRLRSKWCGEPESPPSKTPTYRVSARLDDSVKRSKNGHGPPLPLHFQSVQNQSHKNRWLINNRSILIDLSNI